MVTVNGALGPMITRTTIQARKRLFDMILVCSARAGSNFDTLYMIIVLCDSLYACLIDRNESNFSAG